MRRYWLAGAAVAGAAVAVPTISAAFPVPDPQMMARLDPLWAKVNGCFAPGSTETTANEGAAKPMPLVEGLAPVHYRIAAASPTAQRYFDQGLAFLYGFEFEKAERSFAQGNAVDPECTMCLWGKALAMGPYLNSGPLGAGKIAEARAVTQKVLAATNLSPVERMLAQALDDRYAPAAPKKDALGVHGVRFAEAMRAISNANPNDDVLMVMAAEAAMDVRPWDYWEKGGVKPRPWGARAIYLVETVLARNPDQPEAQHLYIHLTEASANPGRAEHAADRLAKSSPASAHLDHMPGHTYYGIGRFADAIRVNQVAVAADDAMAARLGEAKPFYGYFRHHTHFLVSAAEQIGDRAEALKNATALEASVDPASLSKSFHGQALLITALQARAQFATTAEMLAIAAPPKDATVTRQIWYALRAEALGRDGDERGAMRELAAMRAERAKVAIPNDVRPAVLLAEQVAIGRIDFGAGRYRQAAKHFQKAAKIDVAFGYNEPPVWHQPIEASVGASLLKAGDVAGARAAFDRALVDRPGNGWALWGLAQAQAAAGDTAGEKATLAKLDRQWVGDRQRLQLGRL
jgi:tetratricopeptide (TPR) repeat protein